MILRDEQPGDIGAIRTLTDRAFAPMPYGDGTEAPIIDTLRHDGDLMLSLVVTEADSVVGHVAFSPVTIDGRHDGWVGLGPISVAPERQRQGIGRMLTETGLSRLRDRGAKGCALIGSPAIYSRLGFVSNGQLTYGTLEPRLVQHVTFTGADPTGALKFAPAFDLDPTGR